MRDMIGSKKTGYLLLCIMALMIPATHAAANMQVTAFACNPNEVVAGNQFSCTATVQNTGDATGTLNTATLYPSTDWLEKGSYPETINTNINSGASVEITFNGLKGKKAGNNGFSKIMLDDVTDTYAADNGIKVNVIDVISTATASAGSAASGASVTMTTQATVGGNVDTVLTISLSSCSIGNQPATATANEMTNGQTTSHTWTVTMGSADCAYTVSAKATSNPSGIASKTDTTSSSIACSSGCTASTSSTSTSSTSSSGGGGAAAITGAIVRAEAGKITITIPSIKANTPGLITIANASETGISALTITTMSNVSNVKIVVEKKAGNPTSAAPAGIVHSYISIATENITDNNISSAKIAFQVSNAWITTNNIGEATIALNRFVNGAWTKLSTIKTSSSDD